MPAKKASTGKQYRIDGKVFTWTTDGGDEVTIPMRIKLGTIRKMAGKEMDTAVMFELLDAVAPGQAEALDDMDVNDFQAMFTTWQKEYNSLNGATLGE